MTVTERRRAIGHLFGHLPSRRLIGGRTDRDRFWTTIDPNFGLGASDLVALPSAVHALAPVGAPTLELERDVDGTPGNFQVLVTRIRDAGLLDRRPGYYCMKVILTISALVAGWVAFVLVGNSWGTLGVATFLGLMFTQLAFVAHDAGHQQVLRSRKGNRLLGFVVADALIGLSFGWWVGKHNAHHAHPNQVNRDPDISNGGVLTTIDELADEPNGLGRVLMRRQAGLFFPLMLLRSVGMHVSGIQRLLGRRDRGAALEGVLIAFHAALYLTVVLWVLSPLKALAFIAVQQAVFSVYLGCSFAPNHKGMPIIEADTKMTFAERQVITARNVAGGRFTNFMLGGLNYQIEHHLFPTMPRPNLARAQSIIRAFCLENDFGYCEDTLFGSYRQTIRHLAAASALVFGGAELRTATAQS